MEGRLRRRSVGRQALLSDFRLTGGPCQAVAGRSSVTTHLFAALAEKRYGFLVRTQTMSSPISDASQKRWGPNASAKRR